MSDLRKAAQMALEALESGTDVDPIFESQTITALRAALAQPEPEPAAWVFVPNNVVVFLLGGVVVSSEE